MFELYHAHYSTCSQKVRLACAEKGVAFQSRVVDLASQEHLSLDYLAINPNGVVPTLVHDAELIVDSSVICEYLDEVVPERPLSPSTAYGRARMRAWMRFFEEVPTTAIRVPSFNKIFSKVIGQLPRQAYENMAEKMPLRKHFYLKMNGTEGFDASAYEESIERLANTIARMEQSLSKTGPWLMGNQFTIADIVVIPTFVRMEDLGMCEFWDKAHHVGYWYKMAQARPSFDKAYYEGTRVRALPSEHA